jgi:UDP-N-acetylmuramoyl-tripeptide--D-alanyl-D-alanine ligase
MNGPFAFSEFTGLSGGFYMGQRSSWQEPTGVCVDSREAGARSLFIPLKGERTDGHLHIESALKAGATAVLVDRAWAEGHNETLKNWAELYGALFFPVEDPLKQLQAMAVKHRQRFPKLKVVGVSGSNGKTTTKEMIASILGTMGRCYKNPGNLNSEIGLPLTVLRMNREYDYAVLEMGINHVGEMDILVDIARPDTAVITNIGTAHIAYLGSKRRIAEEKRKIFSLMDETGRAFVFEHEAFRDVLAENFKGSLEFFGPRTQDGFIRAGENGLKGQEIVFTDCTVQLPLPGSHNLSNALAAVAVTRALGADWDHIRRGLESLDAGFGRTEVLEGPVTVVQDCYNANPDSVSAAIRMFSQMSTRGKRILVLGDMLELGEESEMLHRKLGGTLTDCSAHEVFFYGPEMKVAAAEYAKSGRKSFWSESFADLESAVVDAVDPGDLILLKGSRGMALERLTAPLLGEEHVRIT